MEAGNLPISPSAFAMWRTVFALAHAAEVVTPEEKSFLEAVLQREPFSDAQKAALRAGLKTPHDIAALFEQITDQEDRTRFFYHARQLVWCDGDFGAQEQEIMTRLERMHVGALDFNRLMLNVGLTLDDDQKSRIAQERHAVLNKNTSQGFWARIFSRLSGT